MRRRDVVWSRWDEVDRLFTRIMDLPGRERLDALDREAGDDAELRRAVLDLLELSEADDARGDTPGPNLLREALQGDGDGGDALRPDEHVGRYRILGELGRGGMAVVYAAERSDGVYRQGVALKVLRRGFDTDRIVARFIAERQILSDLAHPNIARLLDGGATHDGRPFLVMERVDGQPLTHWADERRLGTNARLRLLLQLTDAVQEAHRRLIVHRDIKPSNILVDADGQLKLLDFGIAKLLDTSDEADLTVNAYPLTWRYASPEQARGEAVTTSSDVYQIGLIMHELLTGVRPFDVDEAAPRGSTAPRERPEPRPPSVAVQRLEAPRAEEIAHRHHTTPRALVRSLRGDLDRMVAKALDEDPLERYRSVEDLALDIRLHLDGRPIRARPAPRGLRLRKWLGRNPWAPPVAAVLTLAATAYIATVTLTARRLEQERNVARVQAERAEQIREFLVEAFRTADPFQASEPLASADVTVVQALTAAAERIRTELREQPAMQADLFAAVATIFANLDRWTEARPLIDEALALRHRLGDDRSAAYASDLQVLARIVGSGSPDSAATLYERAAGVLRATVAPHDPRLADALSGLLGLRVRHLNILDPAIGEEALAIYEAAGPNYRLHGADALIGLAQVYSASGRLEDAERAARESLRRRRDLLGPDHPQTAVAGAVLAGVFDALQRFDEAVPLYLENLRVLELTAGPDHNQTLTTRNNLATTYFLAGRTAEAADIHRQILSSRRRNAGTDLDAGVATSLQNLAAALSKLGQLQQADSLAGMAYRIYRRTTTPGHYLPAFPLLTRSEILLAAGDYEQATATSSQALAILEPALPDGHFAVGVARCRLGAALLGQERFPDAKRELGLGLEILRRDERTPPDYLTECERAHAAAHGTTAEGVNQ
jgi:eukaryotic-like serine/threonine-protein kinase